MVDRETGMRAGLQSGNGASGESGSAAVLAPARLWDAVRGRLRRDVTDAAFDFFIRPLGFVREAGEDGTPSRATIVAPTAFMRRYVEDHYGDALRRALGHVEPAIRDIKFVHASDVLPAMPGAEANGTAPSASEAAISVGPAPDAPPPDFAPDHALACRLEPRYTFDSFIVGKPNEIAWHAAQRVAEGNSAQFNPLYIYGASGLGKTHLMHAIAWEIRRKRPAANVLYLTAERFMHGFIRALRHKDTMSFKDQLRAADVLMIDDVQFIGGKEYTQDEFFHTFNAVIGSGKQLIFSADRSPQDLEGMEERIRSRLAWGLSVDIHATDFELRLSILESKVQAATRVFGALSVPPRVLEFLAQKIVSNVRDLEGALNRIIAQATLVGRPLSVEMAQEVLADMLRAHDKKITIDEIMRHTADFYGMRLPDMTSERRARAVARPRQIAMYLAKRLTTRSLPEIGRKFGGRDHTTVLHAVRRIESLRSTDSTLDDEIVRLQRMIEM